MAGDMGPHLEGAEVSDHGGLPTTSQPEVVSRFPTPFTPVYGRSKYTPKTATSAILGTSGVASRREGSLDKALQHH